RRCELALSRLLAYLKHISHRQTGKVSGKSFIFFKNIFLSDKKWGIYTKGQSTQGGLTFFGKMLSSCD
ncbi:MAG: hypothetical protein Q4C61_08170, partial [Lachnospiraceae bacterium]|nr:hypothetical protein [Lachnospiraceae bacterium]